MDNYSIHKGEEVENLLVKIGQNSDVYPRFAACSLCEKFWSKLKFILGSLKARTYQELGKAIGCSAFKLYISGGVGATAHKSLIIS